jgi:glycosyltransferase involved in cell wall biosynthesis
MVGNRDFTDHSNTILFVGLSNFPYGFAEVQRLILISKALLLSNYQVIVLCYKFTSDQSLFEELKSQEVFQGIKYEYTTHISVQKKNIFAKSFLKLAGKVRELNSIFRYAKQNRTLTLLISSNDFFHILLYYLVTKISRINCVLNYVEFYNGITDCEGIRTKLNFFLFDRLTYKFSDGIIPISEYIVDHLHSKGYRKPIIKIPIICDVERFATDQLVKSENYFCYCGSTNYIEIARFIISSYRKNIRESNYKLYLIISENTNAYLDLIAEVNAYGANQGEIVFFHNVTDEKLNTILGNAKALLVPLRNTIQDIARFPHKVGEYTATGNPIISMVLGEVGNFFTHMENALLAETYDQDAFGAQMKFVMDHPEYSASIGKKGQQLCRDNFDYKLFSSPLDNFITSLKPNDKSFTHR